VGRIVEFKSGEVKRYRSAKNIVETLDIDCRNALDMCQSIHPSILPVACRLYSLAGPFLRDDSDFPLVSTMLREACNEFENTYEEHGIRVAYHEFVICIKKMLPRLLDYTITVHINASQLRHVDLISEDLHDVVPKSGCRVTVRHTPIDPKMTEHEISLILLHRVFSRDDLITLGIPSMGYQSVKNFKSTMRY